MTERFAEIIALINREVKPALGCTEPIAVALAAVRAVEVLEENCASLQSAPSAGGDSPSREAGSCCGSQDERASLRVPSREWTDRDDFSIKIEVSGNILKNGMGVGIPGVGMTGLPIAAALGAVCGRSEYGLEVLRDLNEDSVARAKKIVASGKVKISLAKTDIKLYVRATVSAVVGGNSSVSPSPDGVSCPASPDGSGVSAACSHSGPSASASSCGGTLHTASAVILNDHDNIAETWFDGRQLTGGVSEGAGPKAASSSVAPACAAEIPELPAPAGSKLPHGNSSPAAPACAAEIPSDGTAGEARVAEASANPQGDHRSSRDLGLTIREIYDFAITVDFNDIAFILESRTLNLALALEGLTNDYGLKVGKTIHSSLYKEVYGNAFASNAMAYTAAATDARMAGCTLPAMSNSGSGNQGITVTMPVIAYALEVEVSDEQLARALVLAHLVAIHIKSYLGKLSALCGCVVASTGSSCGLVLLRGGGYEQVCATIKNMIGNIMGMVCDGAKCGCALKVASGVSSSIQSSVLAMDGICISENDGIIDHDIEKTIANLGRIGSVGMQTADDMILDIMVCK